MLKSLGAFFKSATTNVRHSTWYCAKSAHTRLFHPFSYVRSLYFMKRRGRTFVSYQSSIPLVARGGHVGHGLFHSCRANAIAFPLPPPPPPLTHLRIAPICTIFRLYWSLFNYFLGFLHYQASFSAIHYHCERRNSHLNLRTQYLKMK